MCKATNTPPQPINTPEAQKAMAVQPAVNQGAVQQLALPAATAAAATSQLTDVVRYQRRQIELTALGSDGAPGAKTLLGT